VTLSRKHKPVVWAVAGERVGDNQQLFRAADAMGIPYETKTVILKPGEAAVKPKVTASLHQVDLARSSRLEAPWPDLVVTIGRRMSLVALWIKAQSGGNSRIALLNAAKGKADNFDLLIVPAHYQVKSTPRVMRIGLPLIAFDEGKIAAARGQTASTIGAMAKPLHVLLLGGSTSHQKLDGAAALMILDGMRKTFAGQGSIYVSTSRRTPAGVAEALARELRPQDRLFAWTAGSNENPYAGLLAHGETFTVTGDSLSMLTEIARLGKKLVIAELPRRDGPFAALRRIADMAASVPVLSALSRSASGELRDFKAFYKVLTGGGHAVLLGQVPEMPKQRPSDDAPAVGRRLRELLGLDG